MVLTAQQQDHLSFLAKFAQLMLDERNGIFIRNYEWAGVPNFDALITQEALDAFTAEHPNSPIANFKLADIIEVEYVGGQLLALIENKFPQLYAVAQGAR